MQLLNSGEYTGEIKQKMSVDDCIITNTVYSDRISNSDWHYHENFHFCFVFEGGKAETYNSIKYTEPNGSIFIYHSEEKHRWISPQPISKSANIEIGLDFLKNNYLTEHEIKKSLQTRFDAKLLILKLQREMLFNDSNRQLSVHSLLLDLVSKQETIPVNNHPHWVKNVRDFLNDNWDKNLTLSEIGKIANVHPITISKNFRKFFSCTLGEYIRKIKINKSIELIKYTKKSLTDITFQCNFSDQSHFTRTFKTQTGFLPKDFRNL